MVWWLIGAGGALALSLVLWVISALHVLSFSPMVVHAQARTIEDRAPLHDPAERRPADPPAAPAGELPRGQVFPGDHSTSLLSGFPIPPDARVVGSVVRGDDAATGVVAALEVPASAEEVLGFYRGALRAQGWRHMLTWDARYGDRSNPGAAPAGAAYCRDPDGPMILLMISGSSAEQTDLRVYIGADTDDFCRSGARPTTPTSPPALVH